MRRIRAQSSFPAAATAAWVALALLICLSMLSPITAFALPSKATPRKLSISTPYLVYVTPTIPTETGPREAWFERVQQCAQAGVPMVQIRDKVLPSEALASHVTRCRQLLDNAAVEQQQAQSKIRLVVNGHPDMHVGVDGAHFPEALVDRIPAVLLRERRREEQQGQQEQPFLTGVSVHSVEAAVKATQMGVDYLQVGTMYLTGSHPEKLKVEGPALMTAIDTALRQAHLRDRIRLCGIGGITPANCEAVLRAGADGVAVISGIAAVDNDVVRTVAAFREVFARVKGA